MGKPRTNILLLTTSLGLVGLIGQAWLAGESKTATPASAASVTPASPDAPVGRAESASVKTSDTPSISPVLATQSPVAPVQRLSDEANVLVGEMCDLQLMAQGTQLTLDSSQWSALAAVVLRTQAARHAYEAQIAALKVIAPGRYRVEVPVYADAGDRLRRQFTTELCAELGEPAAIDVLAELGDRLEGRFAGFGISVQTLDITGNPAGQLGDVQIARTVTYWNSVEGSARLTTRREIHLPALEDPTGDSWGELLAMVSAAGTENGPG